MNNITLLYEAELKPTSDDLKGTEWDVTIIGASKPDDVITVDGQEFIRSKNGRLYSVKALAESAPLWEGVKVYDNHLTQAQFEEKQGMRSPVKEWLGTIVQPKWDEASRQLRGVFKVVEGDLATKLKSAWEQKVLNSIGLSIDTFPIIGKEAVVEGNRLPIIEGFKKILSVDLVGDPAAGGGFNRIIASVNGGNQVDENTNDVTSPDEIKQLIRSEVEDVVQTAIANALKQEAEIEDEEGEQETEQGEDAQQEALNELRLAKAELMLERKLGQAKLNGYEKTVREAFQGRIFTEQELDKMIANLKEAQAQHDPTGRVQENGQQRTDIQVGLNEDDKFGIEFLRLAMGNTAFNALRQREEHHEFVQPRLEESFFIKAWEKDGKPSLTSYGRISELIRAYLGGDPTLDGRVLETASTSTLATVVKNTVNIMVAADYSVQERWYEPIVNVEEVDTIDDATLARVFGVSNLSTVDEGAAYTELIVQDEEETASFVKRGNYIAVTMETLMRDKINFVRTIPRRMSNAWYNTLSALTSNVFTVNTAAGPVLSDTGALFNATAVTTAGGHANLLTTALSAAQFGTCRLAMRVQTDQPLGAGRRLLINPRYLLVPTDLETTGITIRETELVTGSANNDINPYFQTFDVVVVPDWTDTNNWALVGDPMVYPAIWHIFPRGQRTPQLFTADSEVTGAMFTNDTLRFKVRQLTYRFSSTYDCAPVSDFRPLHKSNVA